MKKLLFVCGCLEPGKDGVGDYSIRLANWFRSKNFQVHLLALNDSFIKDKFHQQECKKRLGVAIDWTDRIAQFQDYLDEVEPDFIFLQYVPYAYNSKGIPWAFVSTLRNIKTSGKWLLMVHESYIDGELSLKNRIVRKLQQLILQRLTATLQFKVVFTSTRKYQRMLHKIGIDSEILPLFGNIPIQKSEEVKQLEHKIMGVYFGSPPKEETFKKFISGLQMIDHEELKISFCGRPNPNTEKFIDQVKKSCPDILISNLGERSTEDLSKLFQNSTFGIARINPELIGKSGAAIAMLEHGLKLWIPLAQSQDDIVENVLFRPELCYKSLHDLLNSDRSFKPLSNIDSTGELVISKLAEG